MKYWCCNKEDAKSMAFYFTSENERNEWILKSGGYEYYDTWESN